VERPLELEEAGPLASVAGGPLVLPRNRFSNAIDRLIARIGHAASWLWPILVAVVVLQVVLRYGFGKGSIMFEELQWHIYAVGFMIGLSYCADVDRHVRVDVLAERWTLRTRAWIELAGLVAFMLPFVLVLAIEGIPYAKSAWDFGEVSAAPGGLPYRWVLKSFISIAAGLLVLSAISRLSRCTTLLFGFPAPLPSNGRR
jgi:TRAP-type mannitol/chloroaromatic compound transport system permease small subunit